MVSSNRTDKKSLLQRIYEHKTLYLLFLPVLIYYILVRYWPMVVGFIVAFKDFKIGLGVTASPWVGLDNYRQIFSNPNIINVIMNTVEISFLRLAIGFTPPIILAIIFNDLKNKYFSKFSQTVAYIPHFFSWVVVYGITFIMFSSGDGLINNILELLDLPRQNFFMSNFWFRPILILTALWKEVGWGTIVYMAALTGVDPQIYEAASIDGAGPIRRIIHITIPSLLPVISFVLCITLGRFFYLGAEQVLLYYNPAVYEVGDIIMTWVYRVGISNFRFSMGTALGLLQAVLGMILFLIANHLSKRWTGNSLW